MHATTPDSLGTITTDVYVGSTVTSTGVGVGWKIGTVANSTEWVTEIGFTLQSVTPTGGSSSVPAGFGSTAGITGGFCVELGQNVSVPSTVTYDWVPLNRLDFATAGTGQSAGVAAGGIGVSKAVLVQLLFDQFYAPLVPNGSAPTTVQDNRSAFQIALWKFTHQQLNGSVAASNWSLNYTSGSTASDTFGYVTTPSTGDAAILSTASSYISTVLALYNSVGDSYHGTTPLIGLASGSPNNYQDLIAVSNNPNFASPVPETSTWAAVGFVALAIGGTAWRRIRR
ncbi:MAG TPA: hypothetical protein VMB21_11965 [Candidatus Limnocylindria bacterium]|nr:hypothetical protein [Candidatus Limnocylindria bacterium]